MFNKKIAILFIHGFVGGNYDYDDFAKEQVSNLIDSACALSKEINK